MQGDRGEKWVVYSAGEVQGEERASKGADDVRLAGKARRVRCRGADGGALRGRAKLLGGLAWLCECCRGVRVGLPMRFRLRVIALRKGGAERGGSV